MKKIIFSLILVFSVVLLSPQGFAQEAGETGPRANKWIDVLGIDWAATTSTAGTRFDVVTYNHQKAGPNRRLDIMNLTVLKNNAAPALAAAFRNETLLPRATVYDHSTSAEYIKIEMIDVIVTSYQEGSRNTMMTLNYEEIKVTYTEFDNAGKSKDTVKYEWKRGIGIL